ncbi:MAG: septal ring lytic transglycosylase RlpA family protein [Bacteroidota bacterium]|nr:septal ring lytic transglycosylase RlpA family protein [Bacteroidota bacterium]
MKKISVYIVFALLLFNACNNTETVYTPYATGKATWYGPGFQGKPTASGEKFNKRDLTAAHRTLKFGTKLRVTNLRNKKQVIVRVNDRGPVSGRFIIDLSQKAAKKIDMIDAGVVPVKLEIIKERKQK